MNYANFPHTFLERVGPICLRPANASLSLTRVPMEGLRKHEGLKLKYNHTIDLQIQLVSHTHVPVLLFPSYSLK